jgi:NAD-specific glutamate dehydrogenase
LSDSVDAIDAAIARQSVKSEDVAEAIDMLKELQHDNYVFQNYTEQDVKNYGLISLAITALQAYEPWIPCSERMPTEDDADEKGLVLTYDSRKRQETFPWHEVGKWNQIHEVKFTYWKPLPEPPKGE